MKKYLVFTILFCTFLPGVYAQNDLAGKWEYKEIYDKSAFDSQGLQMAEMMLQGMSLYLKSDGTYKATMMGKNDAGTWNLKEDRLTLSSNNGDEIPVTILESGKDEMAIEFVKFKLKMVRAMVTEEDKEPVKAFNIQTVKAEKDQIAKKWYLQTKENPEKTPQQQKLSDELVKGTWFDFKGNGKYEVSILGIKENGTWEFEEGNTSIVTRKGEYKKVWKIVKVSETELVLVKGQSEERWIFTTEKIASDRSGSY